MKEFPNGGRLVEHLDELPDLRNAGILYADWETTSGDPKVMSVNPWHNCDLLGLAITTDDTPGGWYVPIGHHDPRWNLNRETFIDWWCEVLDSAGCWVNHNIKYDAHVSTNCAGVIPPDHMPLVDTLTLAKILDSDRLRYGLKELSADWLGHGIKDLQEPFEPYLVRNKDYGAIPGDLMAQYACQDVITNRELYVYIWQHLPEECYQVRDIETALTRVLFDMERAGMGVTPHLPAEEFKILNTMVQLDTELAELVGRSFRPGANSGCFDVLCNHYGLPVLAWTKGKGKDDGAVGNPSFDKAAMAQYAVHPHAPTEVVEKIVEYRHFDKLLSAFVKPYRDLAVSGKLHASYNQMVRTGRMSCSLPNMQQLSKDAKRLIVPGPGQAFLSIDYSQIEFRLIVHYINDTKAIAALVADPDADFHALVAEWCGIPRKPAKNINFAIGFGGGRAKVVSMLAANMDLVADLYDQAVQIVNGQASGLPPEEHEGRVKATFEGLCRKRGEEVFERYHRTLPGLKRTSYRASDTAKARGYIRNLFGRRRHLPQDRAHIAFNTLNQSTAADLMKERTVAVHNMLKGTPLEIVASVHDETLIRGPIAAIEDPRTARDIVSAMEAPPILEKLRIPIRCSFGTSRETWADADPDQKIPYKSAMHNLTHLR